MILYDKFYFLCIVKKKIKKKFLRKNLGPWGKMTSEKKCLCHQKIFCTNVFIKRRCTPVTSFKAKA